MGGGKEDTAVLARGQACHYPTGVEDKRVRAGGFGHGIVFAVRADVVTCLSVLCVLGERGEDRNRN